MERTLIENEPAESLLKLLQYTAFFRNNETDNHCKKISDHALVTNHAWKS